MAEERIMTDIEAALKLAAECEGRAAKAIEPPWEVRQSYSNGVATCLEIYAGARWLVTLPGSTNLGLSEPDLATFIAAARADVPSLVAALRASVERERGLDVVFLDNFNDAPNENSTCCRCCWNIIELGKRVVALEKRRGENMTDAERKTLAQAAIPLEVLVAEMRGEPYHELSRHLQLELVHSLGMIRALLFGADLPSEDIQEAVLRLAR